jgi:hypothetical protein
MIHARRPAGTAEAESLAAHGTQAALEYQHLMIKPWGKGCAEISQRFDSECQPSSGITGSKMKIRQSFTKQKSPFVGSIVSHHSYIREANKITDRLAHRGIDRALQQSQPG